MTWQMMPMSGEPAADTIAPNEEMQLVDLARALHHAPRPRSQRRRRAARSGRRRPTWRSRAVGDMGAPPPPNIKLIVRSVGEHPGARVRRPRRPGAASTRWAPTTSSRTSSPTRRCPAICIQRRDGSFKRIVPWPKGIDPANPFKNGLFFTDYCARRRLLRSRRRRAHRRPPHARQHRRRSRHPPALPRSGSTRSTLVTCGADGVRVVPVDGVTPETVLDEDICKTALLMLADGFVYYDVGTTVRKAKLDGSAAPVTVFDFGLDSRARHRHARATSILYSTDPADRYVHGAGDGWLAGWKFMERGLAVHLSDDRRHLYWLEHAAQGSGAGDLMTVDAARPRPARRYPGDPGEKLAPVRLPLRRAHPRRRESRQQRHLESRGADRRARTATSSTLPSAPTTRRRSRTRPTTSST